MSAIGTLLSGIGTILLAGASLFAIISYSRWKNEKVIEKKSLIAEESLHYLESSINGICQWLLSTTSNFVYSRQSAANQTIFYSKSEEEQKLFNKKCDEDLYEVSNFCRSFQQDLLKFHNAKNRASHLNEDKINRYFIILESILKVLPSKVYRLNHISSPEKERGIIREYFENKAANDIQEVASQIKQLLLARMHFTS